MCEHNNNYGLLNVNSYQLYSYSSENKLYRFMSTLSKQFVSITTDVGNFCFQIIRQKSLAPMSLEGGL